MLLFAFKKLLQQATENDIQFVREILTCHAWLSLPVTSVILVIGLTLAVLRQKGSWRFHLNH